MKNKTFTSKGFTLIELLVVIAIIGVLASVVLVSMDNAKASANNAKRKLDLKNLKSAMESYYTDNNRYPPEAWCDSSIGSAGVSCSDMIATGGDGDGWDTSSAFYTAFVGSGYVTDLPKDPVNNTNHYYYYEPSNDGGMGYYIHVRLENGGIWGVCGGALEGAYSWCN